ncbi:MAG: cytochrome C [Candidatus Saccharibacteria bacterium]|nr:cytochrome C [Pseudorhodobacter sp.]
MKFNLAIVAVLATAAAPAYAAGDATKGEAIFKQCQTCHVVVDGEGKKLAGAGKIGPNLYGVFGRVAGSYEGFKYGKDIVAAGAAGLVWDEAHFVDYVQGPSAFLKKQLSDPAAVGKMAFKVKDAVAAEDVYAYLIQFSPDAAAAAPAADGAAAPAP